MKSPVFIHPEKRFQKRLIISSLVPGIFLSFIIGCNAPKASSPEEIRAFERIGPITTEAEEQESLRSPTKYHAYRVCTGDVLKLQMPVVLKDVIEIPYRNEPYFCRVNEMGNIPLPYIGETNISNKTMIEVEATITDAYYPKYFKTPPAVVCKVEEHLGERGFTVMGLVEKAGVFPYPTNVRYSLVDAIASAGGVNLIADPHYAKIYRRDAGGKVVVATYKIDKNSIDDASNTNVKPGDVVSVEVTARTQTNVLLSQVLRLNFGVYVRPEDL